MKAVLIVDMPEKCNFSCCPYMNEDVGWCQLQDDDPHRKHFGEKPNSPWCPLTPLPERKYSDFEMEKYREIYKPYEGFNACLDEIIGGEE